MTAAIARSQRDEFRALPAVLGQAAAATSIGDRPLVVVTAVADAQRGWVASHDRLVTLSTNAVHRVLDNATHDSVIEGEDSATSVQAILERGGHDPEWNGATVADDP